MGPVSTHGHRHAAPVALDERTSAAGLRAIASLEALKGIAVLLLAVALIFIHKHVEDYTEDLLFHLHIDLERRIGHALMIAALKISDARLVTILLAAASYATVRFVEAWGLWHRRVWAEWFALLSGALYLPWEILKIVERATWERTGVLAVNVVIILYMLYVRVREYGFFGKYDESRVREQEAAVKADAET